MALFFKALDFAILQIRLQFAVSSPKRVQQMACAPLLLDSFTVVDAPMGLSSQGFVPRTVSTVSLEQPSILSCTES